MRIPPKAALPPAREKGEDCTAVPNTVALEGALKVPKSVMTFRRGEVLVGELTGEVGTRASGVRGGK